MQSEVIVTLNVNEEFRCELTHTTAPMENETARRWLDDEFVRLECEPLRASGKVLLADKVLVVAREAGARLLSDATWFNSFAQATHAVLGKPIVRVDVESMTVSY